MNSFKSSLARLYHELTKYSPDNLTGNTSINWDEQPLPFKFYDEKRKEDFVDLSSFVPLNTNPFSDNKTKRSVYWTEEEKMIASLSRILYFSYGITAIIPHTTPPVLMRSAPSAGALYPNEIYICCKNYSSLGSGIFNYQVKTHSLVKIKEDSQAFHKLENYCFNHESIKYSDLVIVVTGLFNRSTWRYKERAYRRILLDSGHLIGNLSLISYLFERKAYIIGNFCDDKVNSLLELDSDEQSLAIIALPNMKNICIIQNSNSLIYQPLSHRTFHHKDKECSQKALHEVSKIYSNSKSISLLEGLSKLYDDRQDSSLETILASESIKPNETIKWEKCSLMATILKRRSCRQYKNKKISKEKLSQILDFTYTPTAYQSQNFDFRPSYLSVELLKTYIVVNNIRGLDAGCYLYQSEQKSLKQIRFKNLKDEVQYICLGQKIAKDCSALIFQVCDLQKAINIYGERAYRYIHIDSGILGQRINIAAIKLNVGASGIGGFFDDLSLEVLGLAQKSNIVTYITTLGIPE